MKVRKDGRIYEITFGANTIYGYDLQEMLITERIYDGADSYPWMKTFAFLPVKTINGQYVWLKTVYKRKFWAVWGSGFHMEPHVEYGNLFDVLTNPCEKFVNEQ